MIRVIKKRFSKAVKLFNKFKPAINKEGIRILLYHSISDQKSEDSFRLRVSVNNFKEQLCYLSHEGYSIILLSDARKMSVLNPKTVIITFDDGYLDNYEIAAPILRKHKMPAVFFISSSCLNGQPPAVDYWDKWDYLLPEHIKSLCESGFEIGSHSHLHKRLCEFNDQELEDQLKISKNILEEIAKKKVDNFSYPYGILNNKIKSAVKKNAYQTACCSIIGFNHPSTDPFELKRIAINSDDSLVDFKDKLNGGYNWLGYFQKRRYYKYA